ncbi:glycosyltransferase family protein [Bacillus sp. 196mf]|uniref:glycosyltransferase family protein n=1 Tax=Bacillus sp. 196mf TaxID=1761754 RepID=UPI000D7CD01C|nr:glycosyltransferase family protein [Bacillus sp. 196mf]PYE87935.1 glycosyl transferase family 2 [Bacillus sp. 196mf]
MDDVTKTTILFITCVNDREMYQLCVNHILDLDIPDSYTIQLLPIFNAKSMASGYNQALKYKAKYKIYLHQDTFIQYQQFLIKILELFNNNNKLGLIGVLGCKKIPTSGIWWDSEFLAGKLIDHVKNERRERNFQTDVDYALNKDILFAQSIDGVLMATQYDLPWREDLFDGFHFYDVSQSLEFQKSGYLVGIPYQDTCWCNHFNNVPHYNSKDYEKYRSLFLKNYKF